MASDRFMRTMSVLVRGLSTPRTLPNKGSVDHERRGGPVNHQGPARLASWATALSPIETGRSALRRPARLQWPAGPILRPHVPGCVPYGWTYPAPSQTDHISQPARSIRGK